MNSPSRQRRLSCTVAVWLAAALAAWMAALPAAAQDQVSSSDAREDDAGDNRSPAPLFSTPDVSAQANQIADNIIAEFKNALKSGNQDRIRKAAVNLRANNTAVSRLNNFGSPEVINAHRSTMSSIIKGTENLSKQGIADAYNKQNGLKSGDKGFATVDDVTFENFSGKKDPGAKPTTGFDTDMTPRVRGKDFVNKQVTEVIEKGFYDAAGGEKTFGGKSAHDAAHGAKIEVMDRFGPDAYENNPAAAKKTIAGETPQDPRQVAEAAKRKITQEFDTAAKKSSNPLAAHDAEVKGFHEGAKQYKRLVKPAVEGAGGTIPKNIQEGMKIFEAVETGDMTPAEATAKLKQMGETPSSMGKKAMDLIESSQTLKPKPPPGTTTKTPPGGPPSTTPPAETQAPGKTAKTPPASSSPGTPPAEATSPGKTAKTPPAEPPPGTGPGESGTAGKSAKTPPSEPPPGTGPSEPTTSGKTAKAPPTEPPTGTPPTESTPPSKTAKTPPVETPPTEPPAGKTAKTPPAEPTPPGKTAKTPPVEPPPTEPPAGKTAKTPPVEPPPTEPTSPGKTAKTPPAEPPVKTPAEPSTPSSGKTAKTPPTELPPGTGPTEPTTPGKTVKAPPPEPPVGATPAEPVPPSGKTAKTPAGSTPPKGVVGEPGPVTGAPTEPTTAPKTTGKPAASGKPTSGPAVAKTGGKAPASAAKGGTAGTPSAGAPPGEGTGFFAAWKNMSFRSKAFTGTGIGLTIIGAVMSGIDGAAEAKEEQIKSGGKQGTLETGVKAVGYGLYNFFARPIAHAATSGHDGGYEAMTEYNAHKASGGSSIWYPWYKGKALVYGFGNFTGTKQAYDEYAEKRAAEKQAAESEKNEQEHAKIVEEKRRARAEKLKAGEAVTPPTAGGEKGKPADGATGGALGDLVRSRERTRSEKSAESAGLARGQIEIAKASTSGDAATRSADDRVSGAGADAAEERDRSAARTAGADRDDSMGKALGEAITAGIAAGGAAFGSAIGAGAAAQVGQKLFEGGKKDSDRHRPPVGGVSEPGTAGAGQTPVSKTPTATGGGPTGKPGPTTPKPAVPTTAKSPYDEYIKKYGTPTGYMGGVPYWGDGSKNNPFTDHGLSKGQTGPVAKAPGSDAGSAPPVQPPPSGDGGASGRCPNCGGYKKFLDDWDGKSWRKITCLDCKHDMSKSYGSATASPPPAGQKCPECGVVKDYTNTSSNTASPLCGACSAKAALKSANEEAERQRNQTSCPNCKVVDGKTLKCASCMLNE